MTSGRLLSPVGRLSALDEERHYVTVGVVGRGLMDAARFLLLGPTEIQVDGESRRLPGLAERALLVQLLLEAGRTVSASSLIDRLWSETTLPVDPANALQVRVSKLRRSLASVGVEDVVIRDGNGYRAQVTPEAVDALEFEALLRGARGATNGKQQHDPGDPLDRYDAALGLWRGEPLSEFAGEPWAIAESARLKGLRTMALGERAQLALTLGRHAEVVADLAPAVTADPTQESLAGLLMVALYNSTRQADALEVYARCRDYLDEELGLEPSLALRSLHERVLRQDPSLTTGSAGAAAPTSGPVPTRRDATGTPTNLPRVPRKLIGRDQDLGELLDLLEKAPLVSLVGPGGAGKTSLAVAASVRAAPSFSDGAYGVRLASVDSPDRVPLAVADALGVPLDGAAGDRLVEDRVIAYLGPKRLLLLLDNCEHVVDAVASFVERVLGACPSVTVLATSREALAIPDELQVSVAPLPVPPAGTTPSEAVGFAAVELFVERARAVRNAFASDEESLEAVARIVRALDGIPLAIELAAARISSMSVLEISERLGQRFSLLTSGTRTAEARQQTLKATVDWSHALLSPHEQEVFARLSVFQGGWGLPAAEAVVSEVGAPLSDVLDTLAGLVRQSMVTVETGTRSRYRMLETLRQYAAERLVEGGGAEAAARRHADYFRDLTVQAEVSLRGTGQASALRQLREEQPNIRSAIAWCAGPGDDVDSALEMGGALGLFWHFGRHLEGRDVVTRLLELPGGTSLTRAHALQALSIVERPRGCLVHPSPLCEEAAMDSLALFEKEGDSWRAALSKVLLAVEGVTGANAERSASLLDEASRVFTEAQDDWGQAVIGFVRMETALKTGQEEEAVRIGRASASTFRSLDDMWGLSAVLYHLGWGLRQFGRYDEAAPVLEEAIDVAQRAGLYNTVQWALADLAYERAFQGRLGEAEELLQRAATASAHVGDGAGEVLATYGHGLLAHIRGDWAVARPLYSAAHLGFRRLGTPVTEGLALAGVARCDEAEGRLEAAETGYREALEIGRRIGEPALSASALEGLARLARGRADAQEADRLASEADQLRTRFGRPAPPHERVEDTDASGPESE